MLKGPGPPLCMGSQTMDKYRIYDQSDPCIQILMDDEQGMIWDRSLSMAIYKKSKDRDWIMSQILDSGTIIKPFDEEWMIKVQEEGERHNQQTHLPEASA